jgi:predicted PurR-regulated permease PerM
MSTPPPSNFSSWFKPWQRKVITVVIAYAAIALLLFLIGGTGWLIGESLVFLRDILWPVALAAVLALIGRPLVQGLERLLRCSSLTAVVIIFCTMLVILVIGSWLLAPVAYNQFKQLIQLFPKLYLEFNRLAEETFPHWLEFLKEQIGEDNYQHVKHMIQDFFSGSVTSGVSVVFGLSLMPLYLFFFLQNRENPGEWFRPWLTLFPQSVQKNTLYLVEEFAKILISFFRGQLLIAVIMGVLYGVGFTAVGLNAGLWIGLTMGVLNLVPYLGTIVGLIIVIPAGFLQADGGWVLVAYCMAVFTFVQMVEGFLLTPKIMKDQTGLHPVTIVLSILFWGKVLNGLLGMVLAIPLTAFFIVIWRLIVNRYGPNAVQNTPQLQEENHTPPPV